MLFWDFLLNEFDLGYFIRASPELSNLGYFSSENGLKSNFLNYTAEPKPQMPSPVITSGQRFLPKRPCSDQHVQSAHKCVEQVHRKCYCIVPGSLQNSSP